MTDASLDPQDDRLDDVDAPREANHGVDEPVVNLDADPEQAQDEESADDKYITVIDGRPETLGVQEQDAPRDKL